MSRVPQAEFDRARSWRTEAGLTVQQIADATGFSPESVYKFESRVYQTPAYAWLRYKRACGDLDAELNGRKKGEVFAW